MRSKALFIKRDLWGGVVVAACGGLTLLEAMSYQTGTLARMGPGYFPVLIGCFLILLGLVIPFSPDPDDVIEAVPDATNETPTRAARVRGMACIAGGMFLFIIVGHFFGFVPATFALVFVSAMGDTSNSIRSAAILALAMAVFGAVVFSWALQLQFPMFRWG